MSSSAAKPAYGVSMGQRPPPHSAPWEGSKRRDDNVRLEIYGNEGGRWERGHGPRFLGYVCRVLDSEEGYFAALRRRYSYLL